METLIMERKGKKSTISAFQKFTPDSRDEVLTFPFLIVSQKDTKEMGKKDLLLLAKKIEILGKFSEKKKKLALTTRGREEDEEEQEGELGETGSGRGRRLPAIFCLEPIVHQILSTHSSEEEKNLDPPIEIAISSKYNQMPEIVGLMEKMEFCLENKMKFCLGTGLQEILTLIDAATF